MKKGLIDWKEQLLIFVRFIGVLTVSLCATLISVLILRFFSQEDLFEKVICFIVSLIAAFIGLWNIAIKDGYKSASAFLLQDLKTYLFVFAYQLIFAIIFKFAVYTSGPAYWMAHFIWLLSGHTLSGIGSAPTWLYILCMIACDGVYLILVFIGKKQGYLRRIKEREKLMQPKTNDIDE